MPNSLDLKLVLLVRNSSLGHPPPVPAVVRFPPSLPDVVGSVKSSSSEIRKSGNYLLLVRREGRELPVVVARAVQPLLERVAVVVLQQALHSKHGEDCSLLPIPTHRPEKVRKTEEMRSLKRSWSMSGRISVLCQHVKQGSAWWKGNAEILYLRRKRTQFNLETNLLCEPPRFGRLWGRARALPWPLVQP